jgi:cyclic pyranopterin phosphate synthase
MLDRFGREVSSLRISVTHECNLNCFFCHGEGEVSDAGDSMSREGIRKLLEIGRELGVRKAKITGGEPLMRPDVVSIVGDAASILDEASMVTNGILLRPLARSLRDAGLRRINISLHSLDRGNYERITGTDGLRNVIEGIDAALESDLKPVKLNVVVLRGLNDAEVGRMADFAAERGAVLQLIELQRIGRHGRLGEFYLDLSSLEARLQGEAVQVHEREFQKRRKYVLRRMGREVEVEVVRPVHNSAFCMNCTRLRVTADGKLKPCLMRNDNLVEFNALVRGGASKERLVEAYREALDRREPYWKR